MKRTVDTAKNNTQLPDSRLLGSRVYYELCGLVFVDAAQAWSAYVGDKVCAANVEVGEIG